jgi:LmbE family N-acetylglucosaminyl deacetylase
MTPSPTSPELPPLLAFGAHPDDIEFGCGGVVAVETRRGRPAHLVVCSRGEAASNGTPDVRRREAETAAGLLGATVEFVEFDGDGRLDERAEHAIAIARIIRRLKPGIVFAPTTTENQHPDHARLGRLVQRATRLARYGGLADLAAIAPAHAIEHLLFYAVTPDAEPKDVMPVFFDISDEEILAAWTSSMRAHTSQLATRDYVGLQLGRARLNGQRGGVGHAIALYPNDPILVGSLSQLGKGARHF